MMSKKQLAAMLCLHIAYLLLGASIFYHIESPLELGQRLDSRLERMEIQNLLHEHYLPADPHSQFEILAKLSTYCGKPMYNYTIGDDPPIRWDFYHSFFFAYTVVSTIGYGNLAPTTSMGRILMIIYGFFGIPINGILLANLGEYFGITFVRIYTSYKSRRPGSKSSFEDECSRFGLCGEVILYLVPGFLFFMFLPACLFVIFEGWDYVLAVYYAFVTLTTIGFGDYVAGTKNDGWGGYFIAYEIFLIVWITFGLGYLAMILGFITRGMRSKKMMKIEHMLAENLKATQSKIWNNVSKDVSYLRKILNEANLMKFKPVYVDETPSSQIIIRSSSCPNLTFDREKDVTKLTRRRRANSENVTLSGLPRIQSDTNLLSIDRQKTFAAHAMVQSADLLMKVVEALGELRSEDELGDLGYAQEEGGEHGFSDEDILASEKGPPGWTVGGEPIFADLPNKPRGRSYSVFGIPEKQSYPQNELSWVSSPAADKVQDIINRTSLDRPPNLMEKFKRSRIGSIFGKKDDSSGDLSQTPPQAREYIAKTTRGRVSMFAAAERRYLDRTSYGRPSNLSVPDANQAELLESTTVADLIRAIAAMHSQEPEQPKRKMGVASLTPPRLPSLYNIFPREEERAAAPPPKRRFSVRPVAADGAKSSRRFSLLPTGDSKANAPFQPTLPPLLAASLESHSRRGSLMSPPPYSSVMRNPPGGRRFTPPAQSSSLPAQARRYSLRPPTAASAAAGPIKRQVLRHRLRHESIVEVPSSAHLEEEPRRSRHSSLSDVQVLK